LDPAREAAAAMRGTKCLLRIDEEEEEEEEEGKKIARETTTICFAFYRKRKLIGCL
jgi:hypothetical protein